MGFVVNNSRYLLLVERERYPNLASKVLGLVLRRLAQDWRQLWGVEPLIVESFVDESRYRGTCYRACGFEAVGATAGYGRDRRDSYTEHGQPKQLYLRELKAGARQLLRRSRLPKDLQEAELEIAGPCPLRAGELGSLRERFGSRKDCRHGHGLHHRVSSTLACAATATLLGAGSYQGYEDVCKRLAVDGKPLALLSAVTCQLRTTLRSVQIAEKSNEIPALIPLLSGLDLEGSLISADAMHCQQKSAAFITQQLGADYFFGLKGNQSGILERAQCKLAPVFFSL